MMIVDTGAEIHVVCERHRKRLYDRTTVVKGAITLDTAGSSVPIGETGLLDIYGVTSQRILVLSIRWARTAFSA